MLSAFRIKDPCLSTAARSGRGPRNPPARRSPQCASKHRKRQTADHEHACPAPQGHRADKNPIANTTIHPTIIKETAAPAVILSFSLVVVRRIQGLSWQPLTSAPCRRISCTARDRSCGRSGPAALPWEIRCRCMRRIYARPDSRVTFSFLNLSGGGRDRRSAGPSQAKQRYRCLLDIATSGRSARPPGRTIFSVHPPIFHRKRLTNRPKSRGYGRSRLRLGATRGGCDRTNPAIRARRQ
jgi:hypothetical protein